MFLTIVLARQNEYWSANTTQESTKTALKPIQSLPITRTKKDGVFGNGTFLPASSGIDQLPCLAAWVLPPCGMTVKTQFTVKLVSERRARSLTFQEMHVVSGLANCVRLWPVLFFNPPSLNIHKTCCS